MPFKSFFSGGQADHWFADLGLPVDSANLFQLPSMALIDSCCEMSIDEIKKISIEYLCLETTKP